MMTASCAPRSHEPVYIRVNNVGYLEEDTKVAIAFSHSPVDGQFELVDARSGDVVMSGPIAVSPADGWGAFEHYYELDFSSVATTGRYVVLVGGDRSPEFGIGREAYGRSHEDLLTFMRQQRCGYNPFLDRYCHQKDGRTFYGPKPDSTFVDARGGWHDAGDQLKYLITGSNATARMLLAQELAGDRFADAFDDLGKPGSNGLPDVLDEAKWGIEWMHRLHPDAGELFHQVADDRDHIGWKWPDRDSSDYGWGPNSYRALYFADGRPQGLREFKSTSTGVANLAGRYAAGMAMAYRVWRERDPVFAATSLAAARDVYSMGKAKEGYQQGNSYGAPYRYTEDTWADDMEWGAAELFAVTGEPGFLEDARHYARLAGTTSWLPHDTTDHYQYYPFVNVGHFALYPHVDEALRDSLAGYYRDGIEAAVARGSRNAFGIGVPFIWCSNNLATALITQVLLYERMTGDMRYHDFMLRQRDWLLGRNPWGTSMFTGIPHDGEFPLDVHTSVYVLTEEMVPGGLVDGPVYATIYNSLAGLELTEPDEFTAFQNPYVVYHDDRGDYSTNEPTMDGTAGAIWMMAYFGMDAE
ncbi:MAG: glycoside hydrolase family 9 [Rhodothermales bacterium]|nr:glycoside hydrolase family 9 [Rhodothermales bacterium]